MKDRIAQMLKDNILQFLTNFRDQVFKGKSTEQADIQIVYSFFNLAGTFAIMDYAVEYILPHKQQIKTKNLNFFEEQKDLIFKGLPKDKINYYSEYVKQGKITKENMNVIWQYFDTILELCITYKKID